MNLIDGFSVGPSPRQVHNVYYQDKKFDLGNKQHRGIVRYSEACH